MADSQLGVIRDLLSMLKESTGLETIGIRLRQDDDYDYFAYRGIPVSFIEAVILGQVDRTRLPATPGGSFWTNSVTDTVATLAQEDRDRLRGRFIGQGYESMALVPIRSGGEIVGLIELADPRRDCLSAELVRGFEEMGAGIGVALRHQLHANEPCVCRPFAELEAIYNIVPLGLCTIDANLCYLSVNRRLAEMHGLPVEAHLGRPVREVVPALADRIEPLVGHVLKTGEPLLDVEISGPDPKDPAVPRTWLVGYHPLNPAHGAPLDVCGVVQDVTAQRQADEALQQSQRLRAETEKLAAAGRVATRIAHEINNPLAGIKNSFILVKKAVPKDHPRYEFVSLIEKEIDRIAEIVRQMYDLHRPHQDVAREIRVADAIHDVVTMLQPLCRRHQVGIEIEMDDAELVACFPEGSLRQILYNLLDNAIEASPSGGHVKIDVRRVEETILISVADQGAGVPEELRTRIFEPFFTTKERGATGSLGLGLSICKGIVEAMQGSMDVQSTTGRGSVFHVKLPLHRGNRIPEGRAPGKNPVGR